MKQLISLKLTCVAACVAALGVGCASSGYARYDADQTDADQGVGVSASADVDTDRSLAGTDASVSTDLDVDETAEGEARATVSALASAPETRATWVNKFPFYDNSRQMRTIETYTFAAPDPGMEVSANTRTRSDLPEFSASLPPGSVFVEAAGGAGEVRTGRVIQHSPNPTR